MKWLFLLLSALGLILLYSTNKYQLLFSTLMPKKYRPFGYVILLLALVLSYQTFGALVGILMFLMLVILFLIFIPALSYLKKGLNHGR